MAQKNVHLFLHFCRGNYAGLVIRHFLLLFLTVDRVILLFGIGVKVVLMLFLTLIIIWVR